MQRGIRTITRASWEANVSQETILHYAKEGRVGQPVGDRYAFSWEDVQWLKTHAPRPRPKPKPTLQYQDKLWLTYQLHVLEKTANQIAEETGKAHSTIRWWLDKHNIPRPDYKEARRRYFAQKEKEE